MSRSRALGFGVRVGPRRRDSRVTSPAAGASPPGPGQGVFFAGCSWIRRENRVACDVLPPRLGRSVILLGDAVDR